VASLRTLPSFRYSIRSIISRPQRRRGQITQAAITRQTIRATSETTRRARWTVSHWPGKDQLLSSSQTAENWATWRIAWAEPIASAVPRRFRLLLLWSSVSKARWIRSIRRSIPASA
jgi:hypothetical protein